MLQYIQDLCVCGSTGYKLPDLVGDWTHLLLEDDVSAAFSGKRRQVGEWHKAFMRELVAVGKRIEEKGTRRSQEPYGRCPFQLLFATNC